jgi:hypothetical protein
VIARLLALAAVAALCACEAVPPVNFDTRPEGGTDDGGDDGGPDVQPSDAPVPCADTGVTTGCCSNGVPCAGDCNANTCGKCGACPVGQYCCGVNAGKGECRTLATSCP